MGTIANTQHGSRGATAMATCDKCIKIAEQQRSEGGPTGLLANTQPRLPRFKTEAAGMPVRPFEASGS